VGASLTALGEAGVLLDKGWPTSTGDAFVPEALKGLTLRKAYNHRLDIDDELYDDDALEKGPSRCRRWRDDAEEQ
jgi:hypothetical protein